MIDDPAEMAAQARRCRRLAKWSNGVVKSSLLMMASDYETREKAARAEQDATPRQIVLNPPKLL